MKPTDQTQQSKESFLLYKAFYEPLKQLSDEELGILFRVIFEYQINPNNPLGFEVPSSVKMAFEFIKNQFRLDDEKYQKIVERNRNNGARGGRPKGKSGDSKGKSENNPQEPKKPTGKSGNPDKPKKPDNENDNVNDNENEKDNNYEIINSDILNVVQFYNEVFGKSVRSFAGFEKNFDYWNKIHGLDKIKTAIEAARSDKFWTDKLTLAILFRKKNLRGEDVDYIEDLANRTQSSRGGIGVI